MSLPIQVAIWTHRHGDDVSVFQTIEGAENWRQDIAAEWWGQEMGDVEKPSDPKRAADLYFTDEGNGSHSGEFFETCSAELGG